jgi:hypothetical protein
MVQPLGQSVFVGSNVTFTAQAIRTDGYQWQENLTNLIESSHFIGVTNSTLTISNAQIEDSGNYFVIATRSTVTNQSNRAVLGVFKPIRLDLTTLPLDDSYQLRVGNQDSSPVEDNEVAYFTIYSTTNLSLSVSNWNVETSPGMLTNGFYQVVYPDDGIPTKFWQVGQQP